MSGGKNVPNTVQQSDNEMSYDARKDTGLGDGQHKKKQTDDGPKCRKDVEQSSKNESKSSQDEILKLYRHYTKCHCSTSFPFICSGGKPLLVCHEALTHKCEIVKKGFLSRKLQIDQKNEPILLDKNEIWIWKVIIVSMYRHWSNASNTL